MTIREALPRSVAQRCRGNQKGALAVRVLGVDPPTHFEQSFDQAYEAQASFDKGADRMADLVELLSPSDTMQSASGTASYRPNTAFIMMAIDKTKPELLDVKDTIKDVFAEFGVQAVTADDIEHEGAITDRVLEEIDTREIVSSLSSALALCRYRRVVGRS